MNIKIRSVYSAPAPNVWMLVKKSSTLVFVTRGFLGFAGAKRFPESWVEGDTITTRLLFFGFIPAWRHSITFKKIDEKKCILYTNEGGGLVPIWNHIIQVDVNDDQTCTYTDDVEVRAGVLTILVWMYAHIFYLYRQFRWRILLKKMP